MVEKIITHNGTFHADDVFAVATLLLHFGDAKPEIIRTRDEKIIATGDCVADVGGVYDATKNRFDHHQKGGAGARSDGVPYAAFGLVWKKFGPALAGDSALAARIEKELVEYVDAFDTGAARSEPIVADVFSFAIGTAISNLNPTWKESALDVDMQFLKAVDFAKSVLVRVIERAGHDAEGERVVEKVYQEAPDKKIIVFLESYPWDEVLAQKPEPLFVVEPASNGNWKVKTMNVRTHDFTSRKLLPESWAGLRDGDLVAVSGVPDAIFCHPLRFIAVAKSKDGALALARLALAE